jgi:hypothetical protein
VVAPPTVAAPPTVDAPPTGDAPPPEVTSEAPRQRAPESPVTESQETVTNPVTTTIPVMPPKKRGDGE